MSHAPKEQTNPIPTENHSLIQTTKGDIPEDMTPGEIIKYFSQTSPVDVSAIARALGLRVWEADLGPNTAGVIRFDPATGGKSGYSITVNSKDSYFRKRFTLAHEIAHFLLHRDKVTNLFKEDRMYRGLLSGQLEEEANRLAADILMPRRLIRDLLEEGIKTPEGLAAKLLVSLPAMAVRLGLRSRLKKETKA